MMSARQRPSSSPTPPEATNPDAAPAFTRKYAGPNLGFFFPFNLPLTPEALAVRILKNLAHFALFYTLVLWVGLSISLVPQRRTSLFILLLLTLVTTSFLILLRLTPNTMFIHGAADKAIVLFALGVVTTVALILTDAGIHLLLTLAIGIPVVLAHAIFWRDDLHSASSYSIVEEASAGETAIPLVDGHIVDV
ncbi:hypothetical protein MLD38_018448 [Melastoma candidum]|uniref:Uncharacterized protein n=1 Tax=Melastoma candidum TaxID=119954 RepID=A0ACB9QTS1_9MYRT|nr:hypothetical protein MLD38_018448 [Melastoma candidum]